MENSADRTNAAPTPDQQPLPEDMSRGELLAAGGAAIAARFLPLVRKRVYGTGGRLPPHWEEGRDVTILRQWLQAGDAPETVEDRLDGYWSLRELGQLEPWGIRAGDAGTLKVMNRKTEQGIPLSRLCEHAARKMRPRKAKRKRGEPGAVRVELR